MLNDEDKVESETKEEKIKRLGKKLKLDYKKVF